MTYLHDAFFWAPIFLGALVVVATTGCVNQIHIKACEKACETSGGVRRILANPGDLHCVCKGEK